MIPSLRLQSLLNPAEDLNTFTHPLGALLNKALATDVKQNLFHAQT
jgi:hypothetical protein